MIPGQHQTAVVTMSSRFLAWRLIALRHQHGTDTSQLLQFVEQQ